MLAVNHTRIHALKPYLYIPSEIYDHNACPIPSPVMMTTPQSALILVIVRLSYEPVPFQLSIFSNSGTRREMPALTLI